LERSGSLDALTALSNRQVFWNILEQELKRIKRTQSDLSLLLVEVDNIDRVKELHSEAVMESVIAGAAQLIKTCLRDLDSPARLGNAEFGIILPETSQEGAMKAATRIRDAVARHTFFVGSNPLGCTVSLGIATTRVGKEMDANRLFKLADMRRYIARHTGGNRCSSDEMAENVH
jgi:diguanylate cyclase